MKTQYENTKNPQSPKSISYALLVNWSNIQFWVVKHYVFCVEAIKIINHFGDSAVITEHLVKSQASLTTQMFYSFPHQGSACLRL